LALTKILACTDDSPASRGAVQAALDLARACACRVVLLNVLDFFPYVDYQQPDILGFPPPLAQELLELREQAVQEHLEHWKQEAAQQGVELEGLLRMGAPTHGEIVAAAGELQPDLSVMGRRGTSGLERLLVGSVTARVIGHSALKVLVVPKDATLAYRRLLIATDGSPFSQAAWQEALEMARRTGGNLLVAAAVHGDLAPDKAAALVDRLTAEARNAGVAPEPLVLSGRPDEAILQVAAAKQVDLIILGSHGKTGLKRLLMGSVAERVIGQAACPVLVVKRPA
jgi:nucleotide-binding universal stress UspA family protein